MFQEFPDLAKEKSEMERVVEMGTGESDRTLANQIARSDITKLYLMSELLLFVVVIFSCPGSSIPDLGQSVGGWVTATLEF